jgi:preprotein translocase subunit YajC
MDQGGGLWFWGVLVAVMLVFMFLPQWMNRRRRKQREEELLVGDRVLTIGGLIGELTYVDFEANIARIKLTEDVEVEIMPGAISGKRSDQESVEQDTGDGADGTGKGK